MPRRKTRYFPSYGANLPNSGPDWIWARAISLLDANRYATLQRDGPLVVRVATLLRAIRRGFTGRNDHRVVENDTALVEAEKLRGSAPSILLELHMRVLAGQGPKTIAVQMGMHENIVQTYMQFFFDVAERLEQRNFITHRVIKVHPNIVNTPEQSAMMAAYTHGVAAVDPWVDWYTNRFDQHDLATPIGRMRETIDLRHEAEAIFLEPSSFRSISKVVPIIEKVRTKTFPTGSANGLFRENLARMNRELKFAAVEKVRPENTGHCVSQKPASERDDRNVSSAERRDSYADRQNWHSYPRQLQSVISERP